VEKYRLKYIILLSLFFQLGLATADDSSPTYLSEKIALSAEPIKACLQKVTSDFNVVESCRSSYFKLGDLKEASSESRYLFLHEFDSNEIKDLRYVWSLFYLADGQLVSTKLHAPREERLVRGGMNAILEGELLAMTRNLEIEKLKLRSLNEDLGLLLADKDKLNLLETSLEFLQKNQNDEFKRLLANRSAKITSSAQDVKRVDSRGELSEQLRVILAGQVK
jgi:hypothetical protein